MSQFLLPCTCGAKIPVNRSQAGMTLPCSQCGQAVDVPTIRKLAEYAFAVPVTKELKSGRSLMWMGPIAAISFVLGIIGLAYGGNLAYERYYLTSDMVNQGVDLNLTEADFVADVRKNALESEPADTWDYWNIMVEEGLKDASPPNIFRVKRYLASRQPMLLGSVIIGGVSMAIFAFLTLLMQRSRPV